MNCFKWLQRFLASIVIVTFFGTNTLTPAPVAHAMPAGRQAANVESPALISSFKIPAEFGKVTDIIPASPVGAILHPPSSRTYGSKEPEADTRLLIHIQEAHANYDAQKNIQNILQYLAKDYGVKLILVEGAVNKLQPGLFNFFPKDKELNDSITDSLMKAGQLTGAEVFLINQDEGWRMKDDAIQKVKASSVFRHPISLAEAFGVENVGAYLKDREAYRSVYEGRKLTESFLEAFYRQWQKQAGSSMGKDLREFLARYVSYEEKRLSLTDWLETLRTTAAKQLTFPPLLQRGARGDFNPPNSVGRIRPPAGNPPQSPFPKGGSVEGSLDLTDVRAQTEWPVLVRYFRLKKISPEIDPAKVEAEKQRFLSDINIQLNAQRSTRNEDVDHYPLTVAQEVEQIFESARKNDLPVYKTRFVFERLLNALPKDFSFDAYPNLRLYIQQMILLSELRSEQLQEEIRKLTKHIVRSLAKTDDEKRLAGILREYQLLRKLFRLELSRGEYQQLCARNAQRSTRSEDVDRCPLTVAPEIQKLYAAALNFYRGAITREDVMMQNAMKILAARKDKKAVLITGGFHTDGFKEKITASGSSYIGITPSIGEIRPEDEKNYLKALLGPQTADLRLQTAQRATINGQRKNTSEAGWSHSSEAVKVSNIGIPAVSAENFAAEFEPAYVASRRAEMREIGRQVIASERPGQFSELWPGYEAQLKKIFNAADAANDAAFKTFARQNIETELAEAKSVRSEARQTATAQEMCGLSQQTLETVIGLYHALKKSRKPDELETWSDMYGFYRDNLDSGNVMLLPRVSELVQTIDQGGGIAVLEQALAKASRSEMRDTAVEFTDRLIANAAKEGRQTLYEHEVYEIFRTLGLEVPAFVTVRKGEALRQLPEGEKLVLKIISESLHKSDEIGPSGAKGVMIIPAGEAEKTVREMLEIPAATGGVMIYPFIENAGKNSSLGYFSELLVGFGNTPAGRLIAFGQGGTFADRHVPDRAYRSYISTLDVRELIRATALGRDFIYGSYRDKKLPLQSRDLERTIEQLARFMRTYAETGAYDIATLEINPLMVTFSGRLIPCDAKLQFRSKKQGVPARDVRRIKGLLHPRSAALIGATPNNPNVHSLMNNLVSSLEKGALKQLSLVYPKGAAAKKTFRNIPFIFKEPDDADIYIVAFGTEKATAKAEELLAKGKRVVVIAGGFAELEEGKTLQERLRTALAKALPEALLLGPNTMSYVAAEFSATFAGRRAGMGTSEKSEIALITQSGGLLAAAMSYLDQKGMPVKYGIPIGNAVDAGVADFLEYFLTQEPDIKVIAAYIEGLKDENEAKRVLALLRLAKEKGVTVIFRKGGISDRGTKAVTSHTGSQAGKYEHFKEVFEREGAVVVANVEDPLWYETIRAAAHFSRFGWPKSNRAFAMDTGGEDKVTQVDTGAISGDQLKFPQPGPVFEREILSKLSLKTISGNPFDLTGAGTVEQIKMLFRHLAADDAYDLVLCGYLQWVYSPHRDNFKFVEFLKGLNAQKPFIFVNRDYSRAGQEMKIALRKAGFLMFDEPAIAGRVLSVLLASRFSDAVHFARSETREAEKGKIATDKLNSATTDAAAGQAVDLSGATEEEIKIDLTKYDFEETDSITLAALLERILPEIKKSPQESLGTFGVIKVQLLDFPEKLLEHSGKRYGFDPVLLDNLDNFLEETIGVNGGRFFEEVVMIREKTVVEQVAELAAGSGLNSTDLEKLWQIHENKRSILLLSNGKEHEKIFSEILGKLGRKAPGNLADFYYEVMLAMEELERRQRAERQEPVSAASKRSEVRVIPKEKPEPKVVDSGASAKISIDLVKDYPSKEGDPATLAGLLRRILIQNIKIPEHAVEKIRLVKVELLDSPKVVQEHRGAHRTCDPLSLGRLSALSQKIVGEDDGPVFKEVVLKVILQWEEARTPVNELAPAGTSIIPGILVEEKTGTLPSPKFKKLVVKPVIPIPSGAHLTPRIKGQPRSEARSKTGDVVLWILEAAGTARKKDLSSSAGLFFWGAVMAGLAGKRSYQLAERSLLLAANAISSDEASIPRNDEEWRALLDNNELALTILKSTPRSETRGKFEEGPDDMDEWKHSLKSKGQWGRDEFTRGPHGLIAIPQGQEPAQAPALFETSQAPIHAISREFLRSEIRENANLSWAEENAPMLVRDYTVVSRQLEAGLDGAILEGLGRSFLERFAVQIKDIRRYVGLVAATTLTGGLGALMRDLFGAWSKNFGNQKQKPVKDIIAVNVVYETIKGQKFSKGLPEEVIKGKRSLGDYLRSTLKKGEDLGFSFELKVGDDFRRKAIEQNNRKAAQIIGRKISVNVYKTETHFGGMPNYYIDAYFHDENGEKMHIFDEVYPDTFSGSANLWRDVHMAVYGWSSQYLVKKLQEQGVVKKKILFVDNEVFVSTPTPLFPDAIHHHINHTVFRPGLYMPDEASFEMFGYSEALRRYIAGEGQKGKINIIDAAALSSRVITGVGLYEHTPVLAKEIFPAFIDKLQGYNHDDMRNTNGVLLDQWQAPLIRALIESYKLKTGLSPEASDEDVFNVLRKPENALFLDSFQRKAEYIKAGLTVKLLLWLKEEQGHGAWLDEVIESYKKNKKVIGIDARQLIGDYEKLIAGALTDDTTWEEFEKTSGIQELKEAILRNPIVSNIRRQVAYKGPDKWLEVLVKLSRDPRALENFKKDAARIVIGGREFGDDAHFLFLEIQRFVKFLGLEDRIITIENYNIQDAETIFQGVSATVMLSDEFLEASATSMMKGVLNMAALIGVWGGAMPELFTIVKTAVGNMVRQIVNVFKDNVTHDEVVKKMHAGEAKITNGFLVEYSDHEFSKEKGGGRRPLADSLVRAVTDLRAIYQDPAARRNLMFHVLESSPKVDMEKSQARAHIKLWEEAVRAVEQENTLFANLKISLDDAKSFFTKSLAKKGQPEFTWLKDDNSQPLSAGRRIRGITGFVEGFREIRMKEKDGYLSLVNHANSKHNPEGDFFAYLNEFFHEFDSTLEPVIKMIRELGESAKKTEDINEKIRLNLQALEIVERLTVQVSAELFKYYIQDRDKSLEIFFAQTAIRENLARYFDQTAVPFESIAKKIQGYAVDVNGQKYIAALNLGEFDSAGNKGGKAWSAFYGRQPLAKILSEEILEDDAHIYQIQNKITGETYDSYPLWKIAETLSIGVPDPGLQVLKLADTGAKTDEKETRLKNDILSYLEALTNDRLVSNGKPITGLLFQTIQGSLESSEIMKRLLEKIKNLSKKDAEKLFTPEGIPPVMAFVTMLSPELLENIKDWNNEVYEKLSAIIHNPSLEKLFWEGKVWFHRVDRESALVLSRSFPNEPMPHVVMPIHFSGIRYRPEDGKAWFRLLDVQNFGIQNATDTEYQVYDYLGSTFYPAHLPGDKIHREKLYIGVPTVVMKDKTGVNQHVYRFQILELRLVRHGNLFPKGSDWENARSETRVFSDDQVKKGLKLIGDTWPGLNKQSIDILRELLSEKVDFKEAISRLVKEGYSKKAAGRIVAIAWVAIEDNLSVEQAQTMNYYLSTGALGIFISGLKGSYQKALDIVQDRRSDPFLQRSEGRIRPVSRAEIRKGMFDRGVVRGSGKTKIDAGITTDVFRKSVHSGLLLGFGSTVYLVLISVFGLPLWVGGVGFSSGLVMIVLLKKRLFTGDTLLFTNLLSRDLSAPAFGDKVVLRIWPWVIAGNLVGSLAAVLAVAEIYTLLSSGAEGPVNAVAMKVAKIAATKISFSPFIAFWKGVGCNILVTLAVWLGSEAKPKWLKAALIVPPIATFITLTLEHSVANMFLIPLGILMDFMTGGNVDALASLLGTTHNLFWVIAGNIVGGLVTSLVYHFLFKPSAAKASSAGQSTQKGEALRFIEKLPTFLAQVETAVGSGAQKVAPKTGKRDFEMMNVLRRMEKGAKGKEAAAKARQLLGKATDEGGYLTKAGRVLLQAQRKTDRSVPTPNESVRLQQKPDTSVRSETRQNQTTDHRPQTIAKAFGSRAAAPSLQSETPPQTVSLSSRSAGYGVRRKDVKIDTPYVLRHTSFTAVEQILEENMRVGGGSMQGFRGVTEKLTDGIISLMPYAFGPRAVAIVMNAFAPDVFANEPMTIASQPTAAEKAMFAKAVRAFGMKTLDQTGDVLILGPEFAFDQGAVAAVRVIFSTTPVIVYVRNNADRGFLKKLNNQLRQANRPLILPAGNPDEARKLLDKEAALLHTKGIKSVQVKAMVYGAEALPQALVNQLSDVTVVTPRMFKNFLNLAGERISSLVAEVQAQFAMLRSA